MGYLKSPKDLSKTIKSGLQHGRYEKQFKTVIMASYEKSESGSVKLKALEMAENKVQVIYVFSYRPPPKVIRGTKIMKMVTVQFDIASGKTLYTRTKTRHHGIKEYYYKADEQELKPVINACSAWADSDVSSSGEEEDDENEDDGEQDDDGDNASEADPSDTEYYDDDFELSSEGVSDPDTEGSDRSFGFLAPNI